MNQEQDVNLDKDRQRTAKEYARIRRWLFVFNIVFSAAYVLLWLFTDLSIWLRELVLGFTSNPWLAVAFFVAGFSFIYSILDAPLSYYSGFLLPHRYGLSHQTLRAWLWDQIKSLVVAGLLGLIVIELVYWLLRADPNTWWLWAALVLLSLSILLNHLAPVLVMPLFYKYSPLVDEELEHRLVDLAERAGSRVSGVFSFDESSKTSTANAALMGMGNTRRIVLADTLLVSFTADEIESVLAHELGHHVHGDLVKGILVASLLNLVGLWLASLVMRWGVQFFGLGGVADPAGMPLLALALSVYGLVVMPASNVWSRWRETLADRYALEMSGKPAAFVNAMTRLANKNLAEVNPPAWIEFLLYSHPSIDKRVRMAENFYPKSS